MHWHRHRCTHVRTRFEHRSMCTTPVVRRCTRSICCQNCPIHWGSRRRWFYLQCFGMFLSCNLGMLRCHRFLISRLDKSLRLLVRIGRTLFALECNSSHWIPVGRNQDRSVGKMWYQTSRHTFRERIQCMQWILCWWRRIRVGKRFDWWHHLHKNDLNHIF